MAYPDLSTGLVALLGLRLDEVTADRVAISWTVTADLHQPFVNLFLRHPAKCGQRRDGAVQRLGRKIFRCRDFLSR